MCDREADQASKDRVDHEGPLHLKVGVSTQSTNEERKRMTHEGDDELFARVASEAEGAGGTAATHRQDVGAVFFGPGAAVGKVPDGLLDDGEKGVGVGLVDADGDRVGSHPVAK